MNDLITIIILGILVLGQAVERYLFSKRMTEELSKAVKAVMSRNINEYLAATSPTTADKPFLSNEEVDMADMNDEDFDKMITKQSQ